MNPKIFKYTKVIKKEYKFSFKEIEQFIISPYSNKYAIDLSHNMVIVSKKYRRALKAFLIFVKENRFEIIGNYTGYSIHYDGHGIFRYIKQNDQKIMSKEIIDKIKILQYNKKL